MRLTELDLALVMNAAMPRLGLEPRGYRRLKGTLSKRLSRRMAELGLRTGRDYLARLEADPGELAAFDALCRMSISRFYRDGAVFDELRRLHLPRLAANARKAGRQRLAAWSAGCASGEEAYSLAVLWRFGLQSAHPELQLDILATDADEQLLARARNARYAAATLRELPAEWRARAFEMDGALLGLRAPLMSMVRLEVRDLRDSAPDAIFDLVLCRNAAFTYFRASLQQRFAERVWSVLATGGALVIGARESLPDSAARGWTNPSPGIYLKPS